MPFTVFVLRVKLHGFHVFVGDEVPKHVSLGSPDLADLTLLDWKKQVDHFLWHMLHK